MRGTNRKRALLVSSSMILLCMVLLVGMTYTLFTDEELVNNHLRAGTLDITLERTKLTSTYLTNEGFLDTVTDTEVKDFSNNKSENIFDVEGTVIVPGSKYEAEMKITNKAKDGKTNVAFGYWLEIDYKGDERIDLANQISVQLKVDGIERNVLLKNGLEIGDAEHPIGVLDTERNVTDVFTVSIEFLDDRDASIDIDNNDAQGDSVEFDLVVHAVQWIEKP